MVTVTTLSDLASTVRDLATWIEHGDPDDLPDPREIRHRMRKLADRVALVRRARSPQGRAAREALIATVTGSVVDTRREGELTVIEWSGGLSEDEMQEVITELGADVPAFLAGTWGFRRTESNASSSPPQWDFDEKLSDSFGEVRSPDGKFAATDPQRVSNPEDGSIIGDGPRSKRVTRRLMSLVIIVFVFAFLGIGIAIRGYADGRQTEHAVPAQTDDRKNAEMATCLDALVAADRSIIAYYESLRIERSERPSREIRETLIHRESDVYGAYLGLRDECRKPEPESR